MLTLTPPRFIVTLGETLDLPKLRLRSLLDPDIELVLRAALKGDQGEPGADGGAGTTDHGALTGLADDDHSAVYPNFVISASAPPSPREGTLWILPPDPADAIDPMDIYGAGVGGAYFYGEDLTDLKVNYDGTGGSISEGEHFRRWDDRSGTGNHLPQTSDASRPVGFEGKVRCYSATDGTVRRGWLRNDATTAIPRDDFSFMLIVDLSGTSGSNFAVTPILDLGTSQFAVCAGFDTAGNRCGVTLQVDGSFYPLDAFYTARGCIITGRSNSTGCVINVNGVDYFLPALSAAAMTRIHLGIFNGGAPNTLSYRQVAIFDEDVGATTMSGLQAYARLRTAAAGIDTTRTITVIGDSVPQGSGSELGKPMSEYVTNRSDWLWYSFCTDGQCGQFPHYTPARIAQTKGSVRGLVYVQFGASDLVLTSSTAQEIHDAIAAFCLELTNEGCEVILATPPYVAPQAARWQDLVDLQVANYADYAAYICRQDETIDASNYLALLTSDHVHPNDSGHAADGATFEATLETIS